MTETLTLTVTTRAYYPPEQRDRDHTSYFIAEHTRTFENTDTAFDHLLRMGLTPERAATVLNRRCEFQTDTPEPGLQFTIYRFERSAR